MTMTLIEANQTQDELQEAVENCYRKVLHQRLSRIKTMTEKADENDQATLDGLFNNLNQASNTPKRLSREDANVYFQIMTMIPSTPDEQFAEYLKTNQFQLVGTGKQKHFVHVNGVQKEKITKPQLLNAVEQYQTYLEKYNLLSD